MTPHWPIRAAQGATTAALTLLVATACGAVDVPTFPARTATAPSPPKEAGMVNATPGGAMVHATEDGTVARVVDGATLEVQLFGGPVQRVRVVGVFAPDRGECGYDEAKQHLRDTAPVGSPVRLTTETTPGVADLYGGQGRYVRAGARDVGAEQVMSGWARVAGPAEVTPMLEVMEADARAKRAGIWGPLCGQEEGR